MNKLSLNKNIETPNKFNSLSSKLGGLNNNKAINGLPKLNINKQSVKPIVEPSQEKAVEQIDTKAVEPIQSETVQQRIIIPEVEPETKQTKPEKVINTSKATTTKANVTTSTGSVVKDLDKVEELMADITNPTTSEWETTKKNIVDKLNLIVIKEYLTPAEIRELHKIMLELHSEVTIGLGEAKTAAENMEEKIDHIMKMNSIGSNSDERKKSALDAVMNFKKNSKAKPVDLFAYNRLLRSKYTFYNSVLNDLKYKQLILKDFGISCNLEKNY